VLAGIGGIAFGVLTLVSTTVSKAPGGGFKPSDAADYLARGHRVVAILSAYLGWIGVLGLICLLARLRELLTADDQWARNVFWGTGLAGAASFAVGWGVIGGQVVAHTEAGGSGGTPISIAPDVTYLLSEVGVVFIFGSGATMLGLALIALMIGSRGTLPAWLRWSTLVAGLCGVAGLAFFPFFLLMLWAIVLGVWLLVGARSATAADPAA
jgi:hypothetical protein